MALKNRSSFKLSLSRNKSTRKRPDKTRCSDTGICTKLVSHLRGADLSRALIAVFAVIILSLILSIHLIPDKVPLRIGQISTQDVRAKYTTKYIDRTATRSLQEAAVSRIEPIYDQVPFVTSNAKEAITEAMKYIGKERAEKKPDINHLATMLNQYVGLKIENPQSLSSLLKGTQNDYHFYQIETAIRDAVSDAFENEIRDDHPADIRRADLAGQNRLHAAFMPQEYLPASETLLKSVIRPNRQLNIEKTNTAKDTAWRNVAPVYNQIIAGDIVIHRGEIVTGATIDKLYALGLQNPRLESGYIVCVALLVTIAVMIIGIYLFLYYKDVYYSHKLLLLISLLSGMSILGLKLADNLLGYSMTSIQLGYTGIICVATTGMLIATLINGRVALLITIMLSAVTGMIVGNDIRYPVLTIFSTMVAIYAVSDIKSRWDVMKAVILLSAANIILGVIVGHIEGDNFQSVQATVICAILSGLISVGIFALGVSLFEKLFGLTTHLGLLELCDPNRRLLREFCQLAPGTYTHSVMVSNLATSAAEAIGADALLCRVGAIYHDLGKIRRAEFFVENQGCGDNAHNKLNPSLSALIVTAHVKDGLDIAEREKLPPVIKAFITEHHGTSLVRYFYHQHTNNECNDDLPGLEQHFRYGGPKPQSRETAILMLADGVEAASRTLERPTIGRIEDLVDKIIQAQLNDGQLDECDLTLRDLRGIRDAFVHLLTGMLHNRVEYPDLIKQNNLRNDKNGVTDKPANETIPESQAEEKVGVGDQDSVAA